MSKPIFKAGDYVFHRLDPTRRGMVTSYTCGFNGFTYRVTWTEDFEDQTHFAPELVAEKPADRPKGFAP